MVSDRGWSPIAVTVLALVAINVASNRVVPEAAYVPFAVAGAALLVWIAQRWGGLDREALGLDPRDVPRGLRWGAALAGAVLLVYLVAFALAATSDLFLDERTEDLTLAGALYAASVRVPLGTVLLEEVAFRSVLPGVLATRVPLRWAVVWSSLAFGLWHVLPALGLGDVNPVADDTVGRLPAWFTVGASVLATAAVGVVLWWLRARTRTLVTPMALHWATNGLGYLISWWAWNG